MKTDHYSDLTKYPKIFAKCYWGKFPVDYGNYKKIQKTVENRNKFVEEFEIAKYISNQEPLNARFFDHCELYKCKEGYVYINSPYFVEENIEIIIKEMNGFGFNIYCDLYSETAKTFIKKFRNKPDFNHFINKLQES